MALRGSTNVSIDAKGRMAIPTRYRDALSRDSDGEMVVTISASDHCLLLYTLNVWEAVERKLVSLPTLNKKARKLRRMLIGHADDCSMDSAGRVLISAELRKYAGLDKKVTLIGQGDKFELWDETRWEAHRALMLSEELHSDDLDDDSTPIELESMSF